MTWTLQRKLTFSLSDMISSVGWLLNSNVMDILVNREPRAFSSNEVHWHLGSNMNTHKWISGGIHLLHKMAALSKKKFGILPAVPSAIFKDVGATNLMSKCRVFRRDDLTCITLDLYWLSNICHFIYTIIYTIFKDGARQSLLFP